MTSNIRLMLIAIVAFTVSFLPTLNAWASHVPQQLHHIARLGGSHSASTSCTVNVTPSSGPVGTLVELTGTSVGCAQGIGGSLYFDTWQGDVKISDIAPNSSFDIEFTIPEFQGPICCDSIHPDGGGPVRPGKAGFHLYGVDWTDFSVTGTTVDWADYTAIMAITGCDTCISNGTSGYLYVQSGGWVSAGPGSTLGGMGGTPLAGPIVGAAFMHDSDGVRSGYWEVGADGGVFAFGDAQFYGSLGGSQLASPIVGIATTPDFGGYWLASANGGVYSFGDAQFYGSAAGQVMTATVVGIAARVHGWGYWLVASDGKVWAFGSSEFLGSPSDTNPEAQISAIASSSSGNGYWILTGDGDVFAFGDAQFHGSALGGSQAYPAVSITPVPDGGGYWLLFADGGIYCYGDALFFGSAYGNLLAWRY